MYVLIYLHHIMKKFQKNRYACHFIIGMFSKNSILESKCIITDVGTKVNIYIYIDISIIFCCGL